MIPLPHATSKGLAAGAALFALLSAPMTVRADTATLGAAHAREAEVQFRGCESAGWCRFRVEPSTPGEETLIRVRPEGVTGFGASDAGSAAKRDRLNALLASMIHQHKQIRLESLRTLYDGTFAAVVIVNGADVAADPQLATASR